MSPDACARCRQPVIVRPTTLGHTAVFDPEPVINGAWRDRDGVMIRLGPGPKPGYRLHDQSCSEIDLTAEIPIGDGSATELLGWRERRAHRDDVEA